MKPVRCIALFLLVISVVPPLSSAAAQSHVRFVDELAEFIRATTEIESGDGSVKAEFMTNGPLALLRLTRLSDGAIELDEINSGGDAISILADRRYEGIWSAIEEWAGPDLKRPSNALIDIIEGDAAFGIHVRPENAGEQSLQPSALRVSRLADAYLGAGRSDDAIETLKRAAKLSSRASEHDIYDAAMLRLRLAVIYGRIGRDTQAISYLEQSARSFAGADFVVNFTINRAALLAEHGRYQEALAAIDLADEQMGRDDGGWNLTVGDEIPGSTRHFDWIRACVLAGLGSRAEADLLMDRVAFSEAPAGEGFIVEPTDEISMRGFICMRDHERTVRRVLDEVQARYPVSDIWTLLQPGLRTDSPVLEAFLAQVRADPRIVAAINGKMRILPDAYVAALNGWGDRP